VKNSGKPHSTILSSILPFLITGCFVGPVVIHGLFAGETGNYWFIFLPGISICVFVWAKVGSIGILGCLKCGMSRLQHPDANDLEATWYKERAAKWRLIAILTWILTFLAMMVGVMIFPTRTEYGQQNQKLAKTLAASEKISSKTQPANNIQSFLEGTEVHRSLQARDRFFRRLIPLPFLAFLFGIIFLIRLLTGRWWKAGRKTPLVWKIFGIFAVICFIVPIQVSFMVGGSIEKKLRPEVIRFVKNISSETTVMVNGQIISNSQDAISEVAKLTQPAAHHSHPTIRIHVEIINEDRRLRLELGRDSELPTEYWVFCPDYRFTNMNEIGRITTDFFNDY
jgi:hypothetical protein